MKRPSPLLVSCIPLLWLCLSCDGPRAPAWVSDPGCVRSLEVVSSSNESRIVTDRESIVAFCAYFARMSRSEISSRGGGVELLSIWVKGTRGEEAWITVCGRHVELEGRFYACDEAALEFIMNLTAAP